MGPFDRFNDRAKRVLALAQDEAVRFNHNYIGTEHLLLGLVREGEGAAARVLDSLGVELSKVRVGVESMIGRGDSASPPSEITLSPRPKKVIELAIEEARKLGHSHVGKESTPGLVREGGQVGARCSNARVTLEKVATGQSALGANHVASGHLLIHSRCLRPVHSISSTGPQGECSACGEEARGCVTLDRTGTCSSRSCGRWSRAAHAARLGVTLDQRPACSKRCPHGDPRHGDTAHRA